MNSSLVAVKLLLTVAILAVPVLVAHTHLLAIPASLRWAAYFAGALAVVAASLFDLTVGLLVTILLICLAQLVPRISGQGVGEAKGGQHDDHDDHDGSDNGSDDDHDGVDR